MEVFRVQTEGIDDGYYLVAANNKEEAIDVVRAEGCIPNWDYTYRIDDIEADVSEPVILDQF